MIKNIIFDFGNVLVKWNPAVVYMDYFPTPEERDYFVNNVISRDWHNRIDIGVPFDQCIAELKDRFPQFEEPIDMYRSHWDDMLTGEMPGMYNLLKQLRQDQRYSIYGLTNWSMETYPQARKRFPVLQLIEHYVVSGSVKMIKPDHRIYRLLLDKYGLMADETLFVDDNQANIDAAAELGIHVHRFVGTEDLSRFLSTL